MGTRARPGASYRAARRNSFAHPHGRPWSPYGYFAGSRKARGHMTDALPRYVQHQIKPQRFEFKFPIGWVGKKPPEQPKTYRGPVRSKAERAALQRRLAFRARFMGAA